MLNKFATIKNVGMFRNYSAFGDTLMRKLNLIHAENGRGKSTLCAVLRSLKHGDPVRILERKTLDGDGEPHVRIISANGAFEFKGGAWASSYPNIEIFDAEFIADNVYSGDAITHDHKRNLCRIVLGEEGVKLAQAYDDIDEKERKLSGTLKATRATAQKLVPQGMTLDAFVDLKNDPDIDQKIEEKKAEAEKLADADKIRRTSMPEVLRLPELPSELLSLFDKTIASVSAEVERKIRDHIEKHGLEQMGEAWLAGGVGMAARDTCPLCDQSLQGSDIFHHLQAYYSSSYRKLLDDISTQSVALNSQFGDKLLMKLQGTIFDNAESIRFWSKYVEVLPPEISFDNEVAPVISELKNQLAPLVKEKSSAPFNAVPLTDAANSAIAKMADLVDKVAQYNQLASILEVAAGKVRAEVDTKNSATIQAELNRFNCIKIRHDPATIVALLPYVEAAKDKEQVALDKENAKTALDNYNKDVIAAYQEKVNHWLKRFSAGFQLGTVAIEYTGRTPRAAYAFEIRGKKVDPGAAPGTPNFRNTLSAGDRTTLALAFFIAQIQSRADLSELVVVFDDPFTSLDEYRQTWTCNAIRKVTNEAAQVIILSHSLEFLKLVAKRFSGDRKSLVIRRQQKVDSEICELDIHAPTAAADKDLIKLRSYYCGDEDDREGTIRCIRPLLENHIRQLAPDDCPEGTGWLGTFLGQVKVAHPPSALVQFQPQYEDYDHLNSYTSEYHHDSGQAGAINDGELSTAVELTLSMIGRLH